jgi:hypothetical protein
MVKRGEKVAQALLPVRLNAWHGLCGVGNRTCKAECIVWIKPHRQECLSYWAGALAAHVTMKDERLRFCD